MSLVSPRSRILGTSDTAGLSSPSTTSRAAAALQNFRHASGLRKNRGRVKEFLENEPPFTAPRWAHSRWRLATLLESYPFRIFFCSLIFVNAFLMGLQADYASGAAGWKISEACFVALFTLEVGLKIGAMGWIFFSEMHNSMDFFIVLTSVIEVSLSLGSEISSASLATLRLLRVLRIFRIVSIFDRLFLLFRAFLYACQDIVWVGILIAIILYIFTVMSNGFFYSDRLTASGFDMPAYFGTIGLSMCTMYQLLTMDAWYSGVARPIGLVYPGSQLFFVFFILLASVACMNLLTAILIESLNVLNKQGAYEEQLEKQEHRELLLTSMTQVFEIYDADKSGELDRTEMAQALKQFRSPEYHQAFAAIGLDLDMIQAMLKHADADMNGKVNHEEFIDGVNEMDHETVKADIWTLQGKLQQLAQDLKENDRQITSNTEKKHKIFATLY